MSTCQLVSSMTVKSTCQRVKHSLSDLLTTSCEPSSATSVVRVWSTQRGHPQRLHLLSEYAHNNDMKGWHHRLNTVAHRGHLLLYQLLQLLLMKGSLSRCRRDCCQKASCTTINNESIGHQLQAGYTMGPLQGQASHDSCVPVAICSVHDAENLAGVRHSELGLDD